MKNFILIICMFMILTSVSACKTKEDVPEEKQEEVSVETLDLGGKEMEYFRFDNKEGRKLIILPGLSL